MVALVLICCSACYAQMMMTRTVEMTRMKKVWKLRRKMAKKKSAQME